MIGGSVSGGGDVGALVGENFGGAISDSYATGAVSGSSYVGGLVGFNFTDGMVSDSYATGAVNGTSDVGGLVGDDGGTITDSYWDTQTSGITDLTKGAGNIANDPGIAGLTTTQLQGALPGSFSNTVWGTGTGLYPYFLWQYPSGTPQAISGFAYTDYGVAGLNAGSVSLLIGGTAMGTVSTGANGYYYFLETPGTISGSKVLTYDTNGVAFADNQTGSVNGFDIDGNYLNETTAGSSYATLVSDLTTAIGGNSAVQSIVSGLANQSIDYTGNATFNIDSAINLGSGTLAITGSGGINQNHAIQAGKLLLLGAADYTLDDTSNAIGTIAGYTTGSLDVTDGAAMTVGSVEGTDGLYVGGGASLTTTNGDITISQLLTADAHPLTLMSAGAVTENGIGAINASSLSGSSNGAVTLNGTNQIAELDSFSTSGGDFSLTDGTALDVAGTLDAGSGDVSLTTTGSGNAITIKDTVSGTAVALTSSDAITESGNGAIDSLYLGGSSSGAATLNGANQIHVLDPFSTDGGAFALSDGIALDAGGTLDAGSGDISLTTTASGKGIQIDGTVTGATVTLTSAGAITENFTMGKIQATTLMGSSDGAISLGGANEVVNLGSFTTSNNDFYFKNSQTLTTTGTVNVGTSNILELDTTGTIYGIAIDSELEAKRVDLQSAAGVSENSAGEIDAMELEGSATGVVALTSDLNTVTDLLGFTTGGNHAFSLTDNQALTVGTSVDAGTAQINLTTTSHNGIALDAELIAGTVDLVSGGTISEDASTLIDAKLLTGTSNGTVTLAGTNVITDLGSFSTGSNAFSLVDAHDLTTTGAVSTGAAALTLTTTGSGHDITIGSAVTGGALDLVSAATIAEKSSGEITAASLKGSSAGTAEMNSATNVITDLGTFTSGSTFELADAHDLTVNGAVNAGAHTAELTTEGTGHDIAIDAKIEANKLELASAATITESKAGIIDAATLTGSSVSSAEMNSSKNAIADLAAFTSGGTFELTDDAALTVNGVVNAGTHTLDLTTVGKNHDLAIASAFTGGTVNIVTTGEATETSKASIVASKVLNVTADSGIELTSKKNNIKKLGIDKTKTGPNKVTL